jgi:hypothetical protein
MQKNQDATTGVWLFEELVKHKPAKGSNDYPISIKAVHLDHNWKKITLRPPLDVEPKNALYEVKYDKDGTRITRILPNGGEIGDLLYWDGDKWIVLEAPTQSSTLQVLGIQNGNLKWVETQDCPE